MYRLLPAGRVPRSTNMIFPSGYRTKRIFSFVGLFALSFTRHYIFNCLAFDSGHPTHDLMWTDRCVCLYVV